MVRNGGVFSSFFLLLGPENREREVEGVCVCFVLGESEENEGVREGKVEVE